MANDMGDLELPEPPPTFQLPPIREVGIRRVRFERPRRRNFQSQLSAVDNAIEFTIVTAEPIPVRALGPALYVGDVAVAEVTADDDLHYRFVALDPEALAEGAPISLGWTGRDSERVESSFRYRS